MCIRYTHYEGRPGCRLDPALGFPHLGTEGRLSPTVGHSPCISQAVWEVSWAFRLMAHAWAFIDIVPPISQGVFADKALPRLSPSEVRPVGGVDGVRHDGVEEGWSCLLLFACSKLMLPGGFCPLVGLGSSSFLCRACPRARRPPCVVWLLPHRVAP